MDIIRIVLYKLKEEGIKAEYDGKFQITWRDDFDDEHYIYETDIDYSNAKLAWFQSSMADRHLLRIIDDDEYFSWQPKTYNHVFGCNCHLIEWYNDYLIFIYREKHDVYICTIKNKVVTYFNFHGEEIARKDDIFFFREYREQSLNIIKRLKIPELVQLEPTTEEELLKEGIVIRSIEFYPNNLGHNK